MKNKLYRKKYLCIGIGELLWDIAPNGKQIGGAPANFAYYASNFGATGGVISAVGNDEDGQEIMKILKQKGVVTDYIQECADFKTGTVNVKYDKDKVPIYAISENSAWDNIKVSKKAKKFIKNADAICYGTLSQRTNISQKAIISYIKSTKSECLKIYDINIRQNYYNKNIIENTLVLSDILKISEEELLTVAKELGFTEKNKEDILKKILTVYSLKAIAYTKGGNGADLIFKTETIKHKGYKTIVVDTVGCGDAFSAILALGILKNDPYKKILKDANEVASYVASRKGAMPVLDDFWELNKIHSNLIKLANNSVLRESVNVANDFQKPVFHITSKSYWINDPCGACYFKNKYHLFFQHNPYREQWGNISWGHVLSEDMVFWQYKSIALTPEPDIDYGGVFSGSCVTNETENSATVFYTGIKKDDITYHDVNLNEQHQFFATSNDDDLIVWKKNPEPIISPPDDIDEKLNDCFRDPFVWKEGDVWFLLLGTGVVNKGGNALLYKSKDLRNWEMLGFLCDNFEGRNWECCNLFKLKKNFVLIISPEYESNGENHKEHGDVLYSIGSFDAEKGKFIPDKFGWRLLDLGGCNSFYAPHTFADKDNNRILWGWIPTNNKGDFKWNGIITLPKILDIEQNELIIKPLPALSKLRAKKYFNAKKLKLKPNSNNVLNFLQGSTLELIMNFENSKNLKKLNLNLISDKIYEIVFYPETKQIQIADKIACLTDDNFKLKKIHLFIDKSVIELYINDKYCMTKYLQSNVKQEYNFDLKVFGEDSELTADIEIWNLRTIEKK